MLLMDLVLAILGLELHVSSSVLHCIVKVLQKMIMASISLGLEIDARNGGRGSGPKSETAVKHQCGVKLSSLAPHPKGPVIESIPV
jgi:hypothetical protein